MRLKAIYHPYLMKPTPEQIKNYLGKDVSEEVISELVSICQQKTYEANEVVYREHDDSTQLYIVDSGQIDIQYKMPNGSRETIDTCTKGDFLVWSALVEPHKTSSIGICRARAELLAFDGVKLRELCAKDTSFGYKMMSLVASVVRRRLQAAREEILDLR
jgi:CRP-like cAMP-binding protein